MSEFAKTLMYVSIFSGVVPLILILIYLDRIRMRYFSWLGLLILISFVIDASSLILIRAQLLWSNTYLVNFNYLMHFILLLVVYHEFYLKEKKMVVILVTILYFGFEIINSIFFQKPDVNQTWSWALSGLIFIGISVGYFARLFKSTPMVDITSFAPGWINIAVFFYFSFSVYLFIMAQYVFTNEAMETAVVFWSFHNFNNILKNCFYAVAIYWGAQKRLGGLAQERNKAFQYLDMLD